MAVGCNVSGLRCNVVSFSQGHWWIDHGDCHHSIRAVKYYFELSFTFR